MSSDPGYRGYRAWLSYVWGRTLDLVLDPPAWAAIDLVATVLLRDGTLTRGDVAELVERSARGFNGPAPDAPAEARNWFARKRCPFLPKPRKRPTPEGRCPRSPPANGPSSPRT